MVTARSFAEPAVTAEIAAGLVAVGGVLVVSEPPEPDDPAGGPRAGLADLGFAPPPGLSAATPGTFVVIEKVAATRRGTPAGRATGQASALVMFHVEHRMS